MHIHIVPPDQRKAKKKRQRAHWKTQAIAEARIYAPIGRKKRLLFRGIE